MSINTSRTSRVHTIVNLSPRENKILEYAAMGLDNKEIGQKLYISHHTVKAHMASVMRKLDASNRTNAIYIAMKQHLLN